MKLSVGMLTHLPLSYSAEASVLLWDKEMGAVMAWFDGILLFAAYSAVGWIYETIICSINQRKLVKRGFLCGPYCPIYGFGALLDILLLGRIENSLLLFAAGAAAACVLEYITSWLLEALFHARWWDYSHMRFNLHGRICLLGAGVFGLFAVVLVKFLHPFCREATVGIDASVRIWISVLYAAVFLADLIFSVAKLSTFNKKLRDIQRFLANIQPEKTTGYKKLNGACQAVIERLSRFEKHLFTDFPRFTSTKYKEASGKIREHLRLLLNKDKD